MTGNLGSRTGLWQSRQASGRTLARAGKQEIERLTNPEQLRQAPSPLPSVVQFVQVSPPPG